MIARLAQAGDRSIADVEAEMLAGQPLGKIAEPEAMGQLVAILLSDAAEFLVGTSLTPDGGATKAL